MYRSTTKKKTTAELHVGKNVEIGDYMQYAARLVVVDLNHNGQSNDRENTTNKKR
jgi:hypothetical protein